MDNGNGFVEEWRTNCTRVIGEVLGQFIGQDVLLIGEVGNIHPTGESLDLRTTDGAFVNVRLPPDTTDVPQGLVELRGTVASNNAVSCQELIKFETEPVDFDAEQYTETVRLILQGNTAWTRK